MGYNWIQQSTTTDAPDVNENFQQVGSGSRLPTKLTSTGAFFTGSAYDLGSDTYKWKTLYCNNLSVSNVITGTWNRLSSVEIDSATNRVEFGDTSGSSALNGDSAILYKLVCVFKTNENPVEYRLHFGTTGGVASGTAYGYQRLIGNTATVLANRNTSKSNIFMGFSDVSVTSNNIFVEALIYAQTGSNRMVLSNITDSANTGVFVNRVTDLAGSWDNSTDTMTSIVVVGTTSTAIGVGSYLELWARG
jgi:hypothetical protein